MEEDIYNAEVERKGENLNRESRREIVWGGKVWGRVLRKKSVECGSVRVCGTGVC